MQIEAEEVLGGDNKALMQSLQGKLAHQLIISLAALGFHQLGNKTSDLATLKKHTSH